MDCCPVGPLLKHSAAAADAVVVLFVNAGTIRFHQTEQTFRDMKHESVLMWGSILDSTHRLYIKTDVMPLFKRITQQPSGRAAIRPYNKCKKLSIIIHTGYIPVVVYTVLILSVYLFTEMCSTSPWSQIQMHYSSSIIIIIYYYYNVTHRIGISSFEAQSGLVHCHYLGRAWLCPYLYPTMGK